MAWRVLLLIVFILSLLPHFSSLPIVEEAVNGGAIEQGPNGEPLMLRPRRILADPALLTEILSRLQNNTITGGQSVTPHRILADPPLLGEILRGSLINHHGEDDGQLLMLPGINLTSLGEISRRSLLEGPEQFFLNKCAIPRQILANPALLRERLNWLLPMEVGTNGGLLVHARANQYLRPRRMLREPSSICLPRFHPTSNRFTGEAPAPKSSSGSQEMTTVQKIVTHLGFVLGCTYNLVNWYLVLRFSTTVELQSRWNLVSLLIGAAPVLLITRAGRWWKDGWEIFKMVMNVITTLLGVYGDAAIYRGFFHGTAAFSFLGVEILGLALALYFGHDEKAVLAIRIIQLTSGLLSAWVQLTGLTLHSTWEYLTDEAYATFLGAAYVLCGIAQTHGECWALTIILQTAFVRILFGVAIFHRSSEQEKLVWAPQICNVAFPNFAARKTKTPTEIWDDVVALS